ncbi:MAG: SDR family NAD(P)-dependent oxidoreductase [Anaerolineaceae bacterium]
MLRFESKRIFITGAASGIGRAITHSFAAEGATLALADINLKGLEDVVRSLGSTAGNSYVYELDVTKEKQVSAVVEKVISDMGGIDILVNDAGVSTMQYSWEITEEEWDFVMDVNAKGCFLVSKHVIPHLLSKKQGKIVNVASMGGVMGAPLLAHYCASKFAVVGLTESIAKELAPHGINVNAVCPGFVATAMQDREVTWEAKIRGIADPEEVRKEYIKLTPMGRLSVPEDVASVVLFLASEEARFMTGTSIRVSGGQ